MKSKWDKNAWASSFTPVPFCAMVFSTIGVQFVLRVTFGLDGLRISSIIFNSSTDASAPLLSLLLTIKISPVSRIPALTAWMPSPVPGIVIIPVEWARLAMSNSACPAPTVSMMIISYPMAERTIEASFVARERPPFCPLDAMDRINTFSSVAWRCIRSLSPKIAPPEKGLVGSTAMTATFMSSLRNWVINASIRVDLPTPGDPVIPIIKALPA